MVNTIFEYILWGAMFLVTLGLMVIVGLIIQLFFDIASGRQAKWDADRALRKRAGLH